MSAEGKALKESYQWQIKSQWKEELTEKPIEVDIKLFFHDKRKHDVDNYLKILLDSCTGIIWKDDSQIIKMTVEKFYTPMEPRIELTIKQ